VILAIFVLSGAAGLVYEIVWARQLVIVFGNTTQAVSTILTGFFGGMAVGAWIGGRIADRVRSPLRFYGFLELAVAIVALATPITFRLLHEVYRGAYPALAEQPGALGLVRFSLAVAALAPATVLMGATLPSLTRYLSRTSGGLAGAFGRLYAANIMGAIIRRRWPGWSDRAARADGDACRRRCLLGLAGMAALALDRRVLGRMTPRSPGRTTGGPRMSRPSDRPSASRSRPGLALVIAFASGLTSLPPGALGSPRVVGHQQRDACSHSSSSSSSAASPRSARGRRGAFARRDPLAVVAVSQVGVARSRSAVCW
jgi:spermidine synthase